MPVAPNDILNHRNEIKDFVAAGDIRQALKRLIDFTRAFCQRDEDIAVMLSMSFSELNREVKLGTIKNKAAKLERNKIAVNLLKTLNDIMENLNGS